MNSSNITTTLSSCIVLTWSSDLADARGPASIICSVAIVIHSIFWIQLLFYPSVRQRGMIWLYTYLLTDLFLLFRYFLFYGQRINNTCVPRTPRVYLCYFEATSKIYTNVIQSYILLGLNVCRYIQITRNRNVYIKNVRAIILSFLLIFLVPVLNLVFLFLTNWTQLWKQLGGLCDIRYSSIGVQIYNLIIVYIIPVSLNILYIGLSIRFISYTKNIRNKQIINNRKKFHRTILTQSILFYTIWIILWSPYILSFQFINTNTVSGIVTSTLNYIQIAIDPAIVAVIDVRFLKAWKNTFIKLCKKQKRQIKPTLTTFTTKNKKY